MKHITQLTTQLDYSKILLEENRLGEVQTNLLNMTTTIEKYCKSVCDNINEISLTTEDAKTKIGNYLYIDNNWFKLLAINEETVHLELLPGYEINKEYTIQ